MHSKQQVPFQSDSLYLQCSKSKIFFRSITTWLSVAEPTVANLKFSSAQTICESLALLFVST